MSSEKPRLSVIIVSYNTRELLADCLASLPAFCEVIVIDNASQDGSPDMVRERFPNALLIANDRNVGLGAAINQGFQHMTADLALLLNSDARAEGRAIERLVDVMEDNPDVIACGGQLRHPDGRVQASCCGELTLWRVFCEQTLLEKLFSGSRLFNGYWQTKWVLQEPGPLHEVEQVMGACLMMRPVEQFDEDYFLYCEDTDLCHRLQRHGRILYVEDAIFTHALGASSRGNPWRAIAFYNRGKEMFFAKHHSATKAKWCLFWDRVGALKRLALWGVPCLLTLGLVGRLRRQTVCFWQVLTCPVSGPPLPPDSAAAPR